MWNLLLLWYCILVRGGLLPRYQGHTLSLYYVLESHVEYLSWLFLLFSLTVFFVISSYIQRHHISQPWTSCTLHVFYPISVTRHSHKMSQSRHVGCLLGFFFLGDILKSRISVLSINIQFVLIMAQSVLCSIYCAQFVSQISWYYYKYCTF